MSTSAGEEWNGAVDPQIPAPPGWDMPPPRPPPSRPRTSVATIVALVVGLCVLGMLALTALIVGVAEHERLSISDTAKILIALSAAAFALLDALRAALRDRVPKIIQAIIGVGLALGAITAYYEGFQFGYPKFYHRWEQYHSCYPGGAAIDRTDDGERLHRNALPR